MGLSAVAGNAGLAERVGVSHHPRPDVLQSDEVLSGGGRRGEETRGGEGRGDKMGMERRRKGGKRVKCLGRIYGDN